MRRIALLTALLAAAPAAAQQSEEFDVWVAPLNVVEGRVTGIGTPANITERPGYDNQPWFLLDGSGLLYTSRRDGQVDVFRHDFATRSATRVTETPEHEFSPTLTAAGELLVVRWANDMSSGQLWRYSAAGAPLGAAPGNVERVGYYAELGPVHWLVFVNDSVQTIAVSDRRSGVITKIAEQFGGSPPKTMPGRSGMASYMIADDAGARWIASYSLATGETTPIVKPRGRGTHYAWTPSGEILMAEGSTVYAYRPGDDDWRAVATFEQPGLAQISRIAVSADGRRIAIVGQPAS